MQWLSLTARSYIVREALVISCEAPNIGRLAYHCPLSTSWRCQSTAHHIGILRIIRRCQYLFRNPFALLCHCARRCSEHAAVRDKANIDLLKRIADGTRECMRQSLKFDLCSVFIECTSPQKVPSSYLKSD